MKHYILGVDQGTTGVAALLFDEQWRQVARGYAEIRQIYPQNGWVEHDAEDLWEAVCSATAQAIELGAVDPREIVGVGLDHEGESVVLWDAETGKPLGNTLVWQDRRTAAAAEALEAEHGALFRERTGLAVDSYFSALKLQWLLNNTPNARELMASGRLRAGTMDAWLVWKLTGGARHITDVSTASRTMLMNVKTEDWDDDLLQILGIPRQILPTVCDSTSLFGSTVPEAFCGIAAPIGGVLADQQAALLGQACFTPGSVKTTYGTGCFLLMNTGDTPTPSKHGLISTTAWRIGGRTTYALDGGVYIAGAATGWLRDGLKIIRSASETEEMALRAGSNGGVYFVPAFTGLAAPYWDSYARGTMLGITGGTTREHIVRATLEATAYQVYDLTKLMEQESQTPIQVMRCDGGAVANRFLMQFQADLLGIPLHIPTITDTTALGAAFAAAIGLGWYSSPEEMTPFWQLSHCYEPHMSADERDSLLHDWHRAVERARNWAK